MCWAVGTARVQSWWSERGQDPCLWLLQHRGWSSDPLQTLRVKIWGLGWISSVILSSLHNKVLGFLLKLQEKQINIKVLKITEEFQWLIWYKISLIINNLKCNFTI